MATATVLARSYALTPVVIPVRASMHGVNGVLIPLLIVADRVKAQPVTNGIFHRQANQPASVSHEKVDGFRGGKLRRDHDIPLIFPIWVIDKDNHFAKGNLRKDLINGGKLIDWGIGRFDYSGVAQGTCSKRSTHRSGGLVEICRLF